MKEGELEKEALAKYKTTSYPQLHPDHFAFIHGYLAGAEPREKRIAELEAQIEKMTSAYDKLLDEKIELEDKLAESRECY